MNLDSEENALKRAIVRFLLNMEKSLPPDAAVARETGLNLKKLRDQDPKTVQQVQRFFIVPVP